MSDFDYIIFVSQYYWDDDTVLNVLDLCSDGCLLSLNLMQYFKVKCLTCNISTDTSIKTNSSYPAFGWSVSTNYLSTKIM